MTCDKREHTEQDHSAEERLVAEVRRRAGHPPDPWEPVASVGAFTRDARDALRAQGDGASPERAGS